MISGIYKILNNITQDCYIGSSKDVLKRQMQHFNLLKKGKNHSKILQRAFDKYGAENFSFHILAKCPIEYLFKLEQWFVDHLKPKYNICIIDVSVPIGLIGNGYYYTEQHREAKRKEAFQKLKSGNFGWKSRAIESFNEKGVIKNYKSLKDFAKQENCSIGNVGKALKKGNKCKGLNIRYSR